MAGLFSALVTRIFDFDQVALLESDQKSWGRFGHWDLAGGVLDKILLGAFWTKVTFAQSRFRQLRREGLEGQQGYLSAGFRGPSRPELLRRRCSPGRSLT